MLDSKRFNYQHAEPYTIMQPSSDATCASRITFENDGTLSIQASEAPHKRSSGSPAQSPACTEAGLWGGFWCDVHDVIE